MRKFVRFVFILLVLAAAYVGWALYAFAQLVDAVRRGDGAEVAARTNFTRLTHSLSDQIVDAYLKRIEATRKVSPMERVLIGGYGGTVADALVRKLLTPDVLTRILRTGELPAAAEGAPAIRLSALRGLDGGDIMNLVTRLHFINPVLIVIPVNSETASERRSAVIMHREDWTWRLAGIQLPPAAVQSLAASLPVK
jgi:hypothetical protein